MLLVQPSSVQVFTSSLGSASAGSPFAIVCTVTKPSVLLGIPKIYWIKSDGGHMSGQLTNIETEKTVSNTITVQFNPLLASYNGVYTCQVSVQSPALPQPISISSAVTVNVHCKYDHIDSTDPFKMAFPILFSTSANCGP